MQSFKYFCTGTNTERLSQHWRLCRKRPSFITTKQLICWRLGVLYLTWPAFVCTFLPVQAFLHSQKVTKLCFQKFGELLLEERQLWLHVELLLSTLTPSIPLLFCKSIVGIDARQLYRYSMCQPMPTGLYTRYEFHADLHRFMPSLNKSRNFENMATSFFQRTRPDCRIETFYTIGTQKNIDSMPIGFVHITTQCLNRWVVFINNFLVKRHDLP